ncbi:hypothetical protein HYV43_06470, partial [Candidatus Micrarchaeota archaeon]|nr:hypothetical protein [Candidatus Micrarchaeota archaeon]
LANGSESALNYSEVNVSFTEANPDSCLLEFNNGTAANYSMNRSGNSCFGNVTISNTGDFNYTVWANDSLGNWNNSVRRFVTLTDDATPPSVSLSSPADSAALSSLSSLVFSFSDAVSSTASCTVYVDGSSVYSNASVLNGTLTSASVSVSSLSSGGGSGSPSVTPVPVVPSVTPVASVVPVVSVQPSVEPSAAPVEATVEPVEEVVVPVEEVTKTTEPVVLESGGASSEGVVVRTSYSVSSVVVPSGGTRSISRVLVETTNVGSLALEALQVTREFKFLECLGSDPSAYEAVGVVFSPRPFRIECGSAVVTWLFDNVEPGESVTAEAKVPGELTRGQVSEGISTPRVVARAAQAAKVVSTPSATASASVSVSPTPGGFDWTLPALGVLVLLGVGAYFVFGRKQQGL